MASAFPDVSLTILATDVDKAMLARAHAGCFEASSLHELPPPRLADRAFDRVGPHYCVKPRHRNGIEFLHQDLGVEAPTVSFDLILCRYVAFTYFVLPLQRTVLHRIVDRLAPGGYLVIGTHEHLPDDRAALLPLAGAQANRLGRPAKSR